MGLGKSASKILSNWKKQTNNFSNLNQIQQIVANNPDAKDEMIKKYLDIKQGKSLSKTEKQLFDSLLSNTEKTTEQLNKITASVYKSNKEECIQILSNSAAKTSIKLSETVLNSLSNESSRDEILRQTLLTPFDKRLNRQEIYTAVSNKNKDIFSTIIKPYDYNHADIATIGYLISDSILQNLPNDYKNKQDLITARENAYKQMKNDTDGYYTGVPALQNNYALVTLYGSVGGKLLVNQKNQRKWYEVDGTNLSSTPTTTNLISWGNSDPFGRTPYSFTDFAFAKYWKKIENNRLITLRRYPAPVYDNLKFPGMAGEVTDGGSLKEQTSFPPMASAITYFGGETGNSLSSLLKFMTGYEWGEVQAGIWEVTSAPPFGSEKMDDIYKGLGKIAELLNVTAGKTSYEFIANQGVLPPDPYENGPYENRIQGPINRIDKVMKRNPGLKFQMDNLKLVFEYVARPIGGINPKAVLLDILGNFLIIGSASAVFFGGAHRFMIDPAKYPFLGKGDGIEKLYRGDPMGYSADTIKSFAKEDSLSAIAFDNIMASIKNFGSAIQALFSGDRNAFFGGVKSILDSNATGNLLKNEIAKKTAGQIPYLKGMRAILTGEPVGEWHITIGNPLNPIAMIGNLICDNIEVEFNDELGPDDFPTEIKITVNLKHGMGRDRDAIESIFNRGMGRIYNLPDSFLGSGDYQTKIDSATQQENVKSGGLAGGTDNFIYHRGQDSRAVSDKELQGTSIRMHSSPSVWDRTPIKVGISENSNIVFNGQQNEILRSAYRTADWVAQRALI